MVKDGQEVNEPMQSLLGRIQLGLKMILILVSCCLLVAHTYGKKVEEKMLR